MTHWAKDITDAELTVLQVLWRVGSATIRRISEELYPRVGVSQYATVQKLLERLEAKGLVTRDRSRRVHVFQAKVARDEVIGRRLRTLAEKLCDGSLSPLLTYLVKARRLSRRERLELRELLDDFDRQEQAKRKAR